MRNYEFRMSVDRKTIQTPGKDEEITCLQDNY